MLDINEINRQVIYSSNSELRQISQNFKNTDHEVEAHHCNVINTGFTFAMLWLLLKHSLVALLQGRRFAPGAVQLIQLAESTLGPDAEASNVTTRGEPQEVQFVHVLQSDALEI